MFLNNKGITIVESLIAVALTGIAMIGLLSMMPLGWTAAGKADSISHATEIMQSELENTELTILTGNYDPLNLSSLKKSNVSKTIGNETFFISRNVTNTSASNTGPYLVRVNVTWKTSLNGVKSSMQVTTLTAYY
jgi:hypothetical protein